MGTAAVAPTASVDPNVLPVTSHVPMVLLMGISGAPCVCNTNTLSPSPSHMIGSHDWFSACSPSLWEGTGAKEYQEHYRK